MTAKAATLDARVDAMRAEVQHNLVGHEEKVTSLEVDLDTDGAELACHVAKVRSLEAMVKEQTKKLWLI